jgi:hypothetical protein
MSSFTVLELRALEFLALVLDADIGISVRPTINIHYAKQIFTKMRNTNPNFAHIGIEISRENPTGELWLYKTQEGESE